MTLDIRTSATIGGAITNRVQKVKRVKRKAKSAGAAKARYRKDPTTRGHDVAMVCISMPVHELVALDAECERTEMARSHFIREAVKHFMEKLRGG